MAAFHDWLESGAGGASNWSLAEVNHEGWRVSLSKSALCLLPLAFCTWPPAYCVVRLPSTTCLSHMTFCLLYFAGCLVLCTRQACAYCLMSAALDLIAHTSCMPQSAACASSLLPLAVRPLISIIWLWLPCSARPLWPYAFALWPFPYGLLPSGFPLWPSALPYSLLLNATKTLFGCHAQRVSEMLVDPWQGRCFSVAMMSS